MGCYPGLFNHLLGALHLMQLTKHQVAILKRYQQYRLASPTILGVLRRARRWPWVALAVCVAFGLMAIAPHASPRYGWFLLGFVSGAIYLTVTSLVRGVQSWPLTREIMDWERVDQLVREHEDRVA